MSKDRLRAECLPSGAECSYVRVTVDDHLAGHAFACRWKYNGKVICWITQLVVDRNHRERGLAVSLLRELRRDIDDIYGIASSHPAACLAAARAYAGSTLLERCHLMKLTVIGGIDDVQLSFIQDHGEAIVKASPIRYIRAAKLHGSLFNPEVTNGTASSVDTGFFVDHAEPLKVLERVQKDSAWPLGGLIDGHEFLLIFKVKPMLLS